MFYASVHHFSVKIQQFPAKKSLEIVRFNDSSINLKPWLTMIKYTNLTSRMSLLGLSAPHPNRHFQFDKVETPFFDFPESRLTDLFFDCKGLDLSPLSILS